MAKHEVHAELAPRLEAYGLDEVARVRLQRLWPILEPHLPARSTRSSASRQKSRRSRRPSPSTTSASTSWNWHITGISSPAGSTTPICEYCQYSAREHSSIGVEARVRLNSGCMVIRVLTDVIARRYWFSPATVAAHTKLISQAILCDAALTSTMHLQIVANSRASRRKRIEEAIKEFGGTIGAVIGAVKEATGSLATTSAGLQEAASETLGRTASASTALGATTNPKRRREISHQVTEIQDATKRAVAEITSIAGIIRDLTGVATSIAAAVEEQSVSARQIASSMHTAGPEHRAYRRRDQGGRAGGAPRRRRGRRNCKTGPSGCSARAIALESKVDDFFERVRTRAAAGRRPRRQRGGRPGREGARFLKRFVILSATS